MKHFLLRLGNMLCDDVAKDDDFHSSYYIKKSSYIKEIFDDDSDAVDPLVNTAEETKSNEPENNSTEDTYNAGCLTNSFNAPFYEQPLSFLYSLAQPFIIDSSFLCMTLTVNLFTTVILFSTIRYLANSS